MALKEFVDKEEKEAIADLVKYQLTTAQDQLRQRSLREDDIMKEVKKMAEERKQLETSCDVTQEDAEIRKVCLL